MSTSLETVAQDFTLSRLYGQQNENIIHSLANAYSAVLELVANGHTVLSIYVKNSHPVISVQNSRACADLDSAVAMQCPGRNGREQLKVAIVRGTRVEWVVRGH